MMRPPITLDTLGWVYLFHMSRPLGNPAKAHGMAQHYCGFSRDADDSTSGLERRAAQHLAGRGAKITQAAIAQGIEISLVVAWRAPLAFEKQIKRRKDMPNLCPICSAARGRKARRVVPVEQLALPLFDPDCGAGQALDAEPWPEGFEFPDPPRLPVGWSEIRALQGWRQASAAAALVNDCADFGTIEDIPY